VEKGVPREGYPVQLASGDTLGYVTTGGYSPTLEKNIALALVSPEAAEEEGPFYIDIRGKKKEARRVKKPFYKKRYKAWKGLTRPCTIQSLEMKERDLS
jgi:aminomethyltransferase